MALKDIIKEIYNIILKQLLSTETKEEIMFIYFASNGAIFVSSLT